MYFSSSYKKTKGPITFQLYGPWLFVQQRLKELPRDLKSSAEWGQRKAAEKYVKMVKDHILNDDLGLERKKYITGDKRPLIKTETYVSAIKSWRRKYIYYVGVPIGEIEPTTGIELRFLASILEHGNKQRNIPPRPVWGPTYRDDLGGAWGIKKITMEVIKKKIDKLRNSGFTVNYKTIF